MGMNIIDYLISDHHSIRLELVEIKKHITQSDLRQRVKKLIEHFEIHESLEEEILFPSVEETIKIAKKKFGFDNKSSHVLIWSLLARVVEALGERNLVHIRERFFNLIAFAEAHMRDEEGKIFPLIREQSETKKLEELGTKVEERLVRYGMLSR